MKQFRFYGDGETAISSLVNLVQAKLLFNLLNKDKEVTFKVLKPYFSEDKNFYLGKILAFEKLPIHHSGYAGENKETLKVVSTNDSTGVNVTELICSGCTPNKYNAVEDDLGQFIGNGNNLRYINKYDAANVQFRITKTAISDKKGNIILKIYPALCWNGSPENENVYKINFSVVGCEIRILPSHCKGELIGDTENLRLVFPLSQVCFI